MNTGQETQSPSTVLSDRNRGTKVALWWLRNYEGIMSFWKGFSWVWVIGIILSAIVGYVDLARAIIFIFIVGVIGNTGIYLGIKAVSSHLKHLEDGPEKKEAHELMVKIIRERILHGI